MTNPFVCDPNSVCPLTVAMFGSVPKREGTRRKQDFLYYLHAVHSETDYIKHLIYKLPSLENVGFAREL